MESFPFSDDFGASDITIAGSSKQLSTTKETRAIYTISQGPMLQAAEPEVLVAQASVEQGAEAPTIGASAEQDTAPNASMESKDQARAEATPHQICEGADALAKWQLITKLLSSLEGDATLRNRTLINNLQSFRDIEQSIAGSIGADFWADFSDIMMEHYSDYCLTDGSDILLPWELIALMVKQRHAQDPRMTSHFRNYLVHGLRQLDHNKLVISE